MTSRVENARRLRDLDTAIKDARERRARQLRDAFGRLGCESCGASREQITTEQARLKAERAEREARRAAA